jgi:repressor LexA
MKETKKTHLLDSIEQFTAENGFPPTIRELCGLMGYHSPSTVRGYVKQLCNEGRLNYEPTRPRTLVVVR